MYEYTHIGLDVYKESIAVAVLRPGAAEVGKAYPFEDRETLLAKQIPAPRTWTPHPPTFVACVSF